MQIASPLQLPDPRKSRRYRPFPEFADRRDVLKWFEQDAGDAQTPTAPKHPVVQRPFRQTNSPLWHHFATVGTNNEPFVRTGESLARRTWHKRAFDMRIGKLVLGSGFLLVAVWVIVGEQISGVSSDAVVNARLGTLRAPMAGTLAMPLRPFGQKFDKGETLAILTSRDSDDSRLDDLLREKAEAAADLEYLTASRESQTGESLGPLSDVEVARNNTSTDLTSVAGVAESAELWRAQQRLSAIDVRIGAEEARLRKEAQAELTVPIDGVLWEVLAGDGEYVERGQEIAKFMACGSALVTLSVPDHVYARLRVGQSAKFRLDGTSTVYDGTITRMAGAGAETIYRNLAVSPSLKHLERYDIALLVPELRTDPKLRCTVGQTGRVFFDSRPLDWLRAMLR